MNLINGKPIVGGNIERIYNILKEIENREVFKDQQDEVFAKITRNSDKTNKWKVLLSKIRNSGVTNESNKRDFNRFTNEEKNKSSDFYKENSTSSFVLVNEQ